MTWVTILTENLIIRKNTQQCSSVLLSLLPLPPPSTAKLPLLQTVVSSAVMDKSSRNQTQSSPSLDIQLLNVMFFKLLVSLVRFHSLSVLSCLAWSQQIVNALQAIFLSLLPQLQSQPALQCLKAGALFVVPTSALVTQMRFSPSLDSQRLLVER